MKTTLDETVGGPDITNFTIKNPLAQKKWSQLLEENVGRYEHELFEWYDAWMKKILPQWAYNAMRSGNKNRAKKAAEYMEKEKIAIVNPDGRSLVREIWVGTTKVAVFQIDLVNEK